MKKETYENNWRKYQLTKQMVDYNQCVCFEKFQHPFFKWQYL